MTAGTADRGIALVVEELERRGVRAVRAPRGRSRNVLRATGNNGAVIRVDVKSRTGGTWQTQYTDGRAEPAPDPHRVVVFVDLAPSVPRFYVVPRHEYEREVYLEHADYVRRFGERPPDGSKHHAVHTSSVEDWHDRWDLIVGPGG